MYKQANIGLGLLEIEVLFYSHKHALSGIGLQSLNYCTMWLLPKLRYANIIIRSGEAEAVCVETKAYT